MSHLMITPRVRYLVLVIKVVISHDGFIQNIMLVESLGYNLLFVSRLADFGFSVQFTEVDCQVFRREL